MKTMLRLLIATSFGIVLLTQAIAEDDLGSLFDDPSLSEQKPEADTPVSNLHLVTNLGIWADAPVDPENLNFDNPSRQPGSRLSASINFTSGIFKVVSDWDFDVALNPKTWTQNQYALGATYRGFAKDQYLGISTSGIKASFGYQTFAWGSADGINPTDVINHTDYSRGLQSKKLSDLSLALSIFPIESLSFELVFLPFDAMDYFGVDVGSQLSQKMSGAIVNTLSHDWSLADSSIAGRARLTSAGFDLSLVYAYLLDDYYTPVVNLPNAGPYLLSSINLVRSRTHTVGLDFKTTLDRFGIWLEGAYQVVDGWSQGDVTKRGPELKAMLGADAQLGPGDAIYTNLQFGASWRPFYDTKTISDFGDPTSYLTTNIMNKQKVNDFYYRSTVQSLGIQNEAFMLTGILTLKSSLFDGVFNPLISASYNIPVNYDSTNYDRLGSFIFKASLDFMPIDSLHFNLGTDLGYSWYAPKGNSAKLDRTIDPIGYFTENNRVFLEITYTWIKDISL